MANAVSRKNHILATQKLSLVPNRYLKNAGCDLEFTAMRILKQHSVIEITRAASIAGMLLLTSCGASLPAQGDAEQVSHALLKTLTSNGETICVDSTTQGEPLAIFRTMLTAPDPARRPLAWHEPGPLRTGRDVTNRQLVAAEFRGEHVELPEYGAAENVLPVLLQLHLNALAREVAFIPSDAPTSLKGGADVPRARVRWWIFNRFDRSCGPIYTLSKPIVIRDAAFISVMAGHEGSTYALRKVDKVWAPMAKWTNWLY
jgi:hypothetical protein